MATKSSTTKNRRSTGKATQRATSKSVRNVAVAKNSENNTVVSKRLGRLGDADRRKATAAFVKGTPVAEIAELYSLRLSNARYMVRQELVETGKVKRLDPTDVKALRKAMDDPTYGDAAWVACRAGISGSKLTTLLS